MINYRGYTITHEVRPEGLLYCVYTSDYMLWAEATLAAAKLAIDTGELPPICKWQRRCSFCDKWFRLERADRVYCSRRCYRLHAKCGKVDPPAVLLPFRK